MHQSLIFLQSFRTAATRVQRLGERAHETKTRAEEPFRANNRLDRSNTLLLSDGHGPCGRRGFRHRSGGIFQGRQKLHDLSQGRQGETRTRNIHDAHGVHCGPELSLCQERSAGSYRIHLKKLLNFALSLLIHFKEVQCSLKEVPVYFCIQHHCRENME